MDGTCSQVVIDYPRGSMVITYPFLIIACQNSFPGSSLRLHPRGRLPTPWNLWIDLPPSWIRDVD